VFGSMKKKTHFIMLLCYSMHTTVQEWTSGPCIPGVTSYQEVMSICCHCQVYVGVGKRQTTHTYVYAYKHIDTAMLFLL
jgi:hypothetical protein